MATEGLTRKVLIHAPSGSTHEEVIEPDLPVSFGSADANTIVIRKPGIAEQHCTIVVVAGRTVLVSVSPALPTLVNSQPVDRVELKDGDTITIGPIEVIYREEEAAPAVEAATASPSSGGGPKPPARRRKPLVAGQPTKTPKPTYGRGRAAALCAAASILVVVLAAGGYVLTTAERFKITRLRSRVETALDQGRFRQAQQLADQFAAQFPNAPGIAAVQEAALYASICDRLGPRLVERLGDMQNLVREYLETFPEGDRRVDLLPRVHDEYVRAAQVLAERSQLSPANIARAENLLSLAARLSQDASGITIDDARLAAVQRTIADRQDQIRFRDALRTLRANRDRANTEGDFGGFFDQLQRISAFWPTRELPEDVRIEIAEIRASERAAARFRAERREALDVSPPDFAPFERETVNVRYAIGGEADADDRRLCVVYGSVLYALGAGDGKLVWSQPLRHDALWQPAASESCGLVITGDGVTGLAGWDLADGAHRWSFDAGAEVLGPPVWIGEFVYALTASGDLLRIDSNGKCVGRWRLRAPFECPGGFDTRAGRWAGISANGTLITIDLFGGDCTCIARNVARPHAVTAAPRPLGNYVIVAESDPSGGSNLRVLWVADGVTRLHRTFALAGRVRTPPVVSQGVLAVMTDAGHTYVFACNATALDEGVFLLAESDESPTTFRSLLTGVEVSYRTVCWLEIGRRLTSVTVDLLAEHAKPRGLGDGASAEFGDVCLDAHPVGNDLVVVATPSSGQGLLATRVTPGPSPTIHWQTAVGEPWYPLPRSPTDAPMYARTDGALATWVASETVPEAGFRVEASNATGSIPRIRAGHVFHWDSARKRALICRTDVVTGKSEISALERDRSWRTVWRYRLPEKVAVAPLLWSDRLFVLSRVGDALLLDLNSGLPQTRWTEVCPPIATPSTGPWVVQLADDRIGVCDGRAVHFVRRNEHDRLVAEATIDLAALGLEGDLRDFVVSGERAYLIDTTGQLVGTSLPGLEPGGRASLNPGTRLRPLGESGSVLAYSHAGLLERFDDGTRTWTWILPQSETMLGPPTVCGSDIVVTTVDGDIYVIDLREGQKCELYSSALRWAGPLYATPTHIVGLTIAGELWSCPRSAAHVTARND